MQYVCHNSRCGRWVRRWLGTRGNRKTLSRIQDLLALNHDWSNVTQLILFVALSPNRVFPSCLSTPATHSPSANHQEQQQLNIYLRIICFAKRMSFVQGDRWELCGGMGVRFTFEIKVRLTEMKVLIPRMSASLPFERDLSSE